MAMTNRKRANERSDGSHFREIGRVTVRHSQLEHALAVMIFELLDEAPGVRLLTSHLSFEGLCNVVDALVTDQLPEEAHREVENLLKQAKHLNGERVYIVHASWSNPDDSGEVLLRQKLKRSGDIEATTVPSSRIAGVADAMETLIPELIGFLTRYGVIETPEDEEQGVIRWLEGKQPEDGES